MRYAHRILVSKHDDKRSLGDLRVDGRATLKWILEK
jgi:hypothetical protein